MTLEDWLRNNEVDVVRNSFRKGEAQGEMRGEARGEARGELKGAITTLCEIFNIELTPAQREALKRLDIPELASLRERIKRERAWPL